MYLTLLYLSLFNLSLFFVTYQVHSNQFFIILNGICGLLILIILIEVLFFGSSCYIILLDWCRLGSLSININFLFDKVNTILLFLIIIIGNIVLCFSFNYLKNDPHLVRFIFLISLFILLMILFSCSGNNLILFLGWEGIGLMSYALIGFWFTRYEANNSSIMAVTYNRVGDCGLY